MSSPSLTFQRSKQVSRAAWSDKAGVVESSGQVRELNEFLYPRVWARETRLITMRSIPDYVEFVLL